MPLGAALLELRECAARLALPEVRLVRLPLHLMHPVCIRVQGAYLGMHCMISFPCQAVCGKLFPFTLVCRTLTHSLPAATTFPCSCTGLSCQATHACTTCSQGSRSTPTAVPAPAQPRTLVMAPQFQGVKLRAHRSTCAARWSCPRFAPA